MKKYGVLLAIIAVSTTLQGSHTHFGVKFTNKEHIKFTKGSAYQNHYPSFYGDVITQCEGGDKDRCKFAIEMLSDIVKSKQSFNFYQLCWKKLFWVKQRMDKYVTLIEHLKDRKILIERLEELPNQERITPGDIRTIFEKVRPNKSPYDSYFSEHGRSYDFDDYNLAPNDPGCDPDTGEIHPLINLKSDSKEIFDCKVFKVNKSRPECQYWSALLHEAQQTVDDQKLVDKLQRFSTMKEY